MLVHRHVFEIFLLMFTVTFRHCLGTTCLVCSSFVSNEDCNAKGIIRNCRPFEVCENKATNLNTKVLITKRCTPRRSCRDDCRQQSTVCRTCCRFDDCNQDLLVTLPRQEKDGDTRIEPLQSSPSNSGCNTLHLASVAMRCVRLKFGNAAGTTCLFWCSRYDYVLNGPSRLTCVMTSDGAQWSGTSPSCVDKKFARNHAHRGPCTRLQFDNETTDMMCSNEFNFKSRCTFRCKEGYYMVEVDSMDAIPSNVRKSVCWEGVQDPVVWTRPPPRCMKKKCPILVREEFSTAICTNWIRVDSVCDFSCLPGFKRIGPRIVSCLDVDPDGPDAFWNDTVPTCEPRECPLMEVAPGILFARCSHGDYFRSECEFFCARGYYMTSSGDDDPLEQNKATSKCKVSREDEMLWKPAPPSCFIKTCPDASFIENGNVTCTDDNRFMSTCVFSCGDAFLLSGIESVICIEGPGGNSQFGTWDSALPWCRPKVCDPMEYNEENTEVSCSDDFKYRTTCSYTCKAGYFMTSNNGQTFIPTGQSETKCIISPQRTLVWSEPAPLCHIKSCDELSDPANGFVSCSDANNHGSECFFTCSTGYELQGRRRLNCQDSGSYIPKQAWDFDPPWCKAKPCPRLVYDEPTTNVNCSHGISFRSICTFKCKEGYYMPSPTTDEVMGNSATVCVLNEASGLEWSDKAPECLLKTCRELSPPTNGGVRCNDGTNHNAMCVFSCDPGYEPDGVSALRCVDDGYNSKEGVWNNESPSCKRRSCYIFDIDIASTGYTCNEELKFMSQCEFHCMEGHYMARGPDVVDVAITTCGVVRNVMTWTSSPPECRLKACPMIQQPDRGLQRCNNANNFGSACMFMCSPGFYLDGQRMLQCEDNGINNPLGVWNHPIPTCERNPCPLRQLEETDKLEEACSNGYVFESRCNYSCAVGYYMSHEGGVTDINMVHINCGVTGRDMTWSSDLPTCRTKHCTDENRVPENGEASCTDGNNFGSTCSFTCDRGYMVRGNTTDSCQDSGYNNPIGPWTSASPVCEPRSCNKINFDTISLAMACSKVVKFKSICEFTCRTGYYAVHEVDGSFLSRANTTCMVNDDDDMIWSDKPPKCLKKTCEPHPEFENGGISCTDGTSYQSDCSFQCHPGFRLVGDAKSTCIDTDPYSRYGEWSAELPVCERRPCPDLKYDKDTVTVNCDTSNLFQSVCDFGCFHGYYMTSPKDAKHIVDVATSQCDVRGQRMYWTEASPNCLKKRCPKPRKPEDGKVVCDDVNFFESSCSFSCSIVRELKGAETITCGANDFNIPEGEWDEPFPACELRLCPDWEINRRAIGETCTNFYKYGSRCTFSCNEGFYIPPKSKTNDLGHTEAECSIDGTIMTWAGMPPVCEIKTCLPLKVPGNGSYGCSEGLKFDTICTFGCTRGFLLIGNIWLRCEDDGLEGPMGIWNGTEPVCEPRSCEELEYDHDTQEVECNFGVKYGSVCDFKCIEGYYMSDKNRLDVINNASAVCDVNPRDNKAVLWNHDDPKCLIKTCPDLVPPADGVVECETGTTFGSKCLFHCQPGFNAVGLLTTTCKDDGQNIPTGVWSKVAPYCEPKSCTRLVSDNTTNFECTDRWKYRSVCTFTCNKGYFITEGDGRTIVESGQKTTRCGLGTGDQMTWSQRLPNCLSKYCLAIRPKRNMTIDCTDKFKYNSRCTFKCDPPLKILGPPVLNCIDDEKSTFSGKWDGKHWGLRCKR